MSQLMGKTGSAMGAKNSGVGRGDGNRVGSVAGDDSRKDATAAVARDGADQLNAAAVFEPIAEVEAYMAHFVATRPLPTNLREAIEYTLLGGGKRMRPVLVVHACEAVGGDRAAAMPPAAAIEMVHAFSLVHDDLPAMDDDDLRRGRPTLHRHTNEAMAILAGDALLGLAFELLATEGDDRGSQRSKLVAELAIANNDMIAGQVYDTLPDFADSVSPMDRLRTIHRNKTGALIRAAVRMGAIAGNATESQLQHLTHFAETIGLMFQVMDDLLDVTQTTEHLGKTAGKDVAQSKLTYPSLIGIEATRKEIDRLRELANGELRHLKLEGTPLHQLCDLMASRTR